MPAVLPQVSPQAGLEVSQSGVRRGRRPGDPRGGWGDDVCNCVSAAFILLHQRDVGLAALASWRPRARKDAVRPPAERLAPVAAVAASTLRIITFNALTGWKAYSS